MLTATFTSPVSFQTVNVYFGDDALVLQPEERIAAAYADASSTSSSIFDGTPFPYFSDVSIGGVSSVTPLHATSSYLDDADLTHSIPGIGAQTFAPPPLIDIDLPGPSSQTVINGTFSDDTLEGNAANNIIAGGLGHDVLIGAGGADTFIFNRGDGRDTISDFDANGREHDVIDFTLAPVDNFADIKELAHERGNDLVLNFGHGDSVTLRNVELQDLHRWDIVM